MAAAGALVVNADDWGLDHDTTRRIFHCFQRQMISSATGMVFMADSEGAAALACERSLDIGLHLNLTTRLSARTVGQQLLHHHEAVSTFLLKTRMAPILYHPGLANSFEYVVGKQLDEFARLYAHRPNHIDGHHHMHLCANVVFGNLLPAGVPVRRNFTFYPGEKSVWNRVYRRMQDAYVNRRHPMPDYLFELSSVVRLCQMERIITLARNAVVEIETHPGRLSEYKLLLQGGVRALLGSVPVASRFMPAASNNDN